MPVYTIEVYSRENIPDVFGMGVKKSAEELGISHIEDVRVSELYRFSGSISSVHLRDISEKLLIDPVIQEYSVYDKTLEKKGFWAVEVWYRQGVTDTVAATAVSAAKDLGIKPSFSVSTGKKYYLKGRLARKDIQAISQKILSNSLIHDCRIYDFTRRKKK